MSYNVDEIYNNIEGTPRAVIYARCSTQKEVQLNAIETQEKELIEECKQKKWEVVDIYKENISGTTSDRDEYQRLLQDIGELDKFQIIVIKDTDRLARETVESLMFINYIIENNKLLYISSEKKFLNPESESDKILFTLNATFDELFSMKLSEKIRRSHRTRQNYMLHPNIGKAYGWDKKDKNTYEINKEEGGYILQAVELLEEGKAFSYISREMYRRGARSPYTSKEHKNYTKGVNDLETYNDMISATSWENILTSPRLYGTVIMHKYEKQFKKSTRDKVPEKLWIPFENALPAIITKERYDNYMEEYYNRKKGNKHNYVRRGVHSLTSKLYCAECGGKFYNIKKNYKNRNGISNLWSCNNKINKKVCNNISINETTLSNIIYTYVLNKYSNIFNNIDSIIDDTIKDIKAALASNDFEKIHKKNEKEINRQNDRLSSLMDNLIDETISKENYKMKENEILNKIKQLKEENKKIEKQMLLCEGSEQRLNNIRESIKKNNLVEESIKNGLLKCVYKIYVHKDGLLDVSMNNSIFDLLGINDKLLSDNMNELIQFQVLYQKESVYNTYNDDKDKRVYEMLKNNSNYKVKDLCEIMQLSDSAIRKSTKRLIESGYIKYNNLGNHTGVWEILKEM